MYVSLVDHLAGRTIPSRQDVIARVRGGALTVADALDVDHPAVAQLLAGTNIALECADTRALADATSPALRPSTYGASHGQADAVSVQINKQVAQTLRGGLAVCVGNTVSTSNKGLVGNAHSRTTVVAMPERCDVDGPKLRGSQPGGNLNRRWLSAPPTSTSVPFDAADGTHVGWVDPEIRTIWLAFHPWLDRTNTRTSSQTDARGELYGELLDRAILLLPALGPALDRDVQRQWNRLAAFAKTLIKTLHGPALRPGGLLVDDPLRMNKIRLTAGIREAQEKIALCAFLNDLHPVQPVQPSSDQLLDAAIDLHSRVEQVEGIASCTLRADGISATSDPLGLAAADGSKVLVGAVAITVTIDNTGTHALNVRYADARFPGRSSYQSPLIAKAGLTADQIVQEIDRILIDGGEIVLTPRMAADLDFCEQLGRRPNVGTVDLLA